MLKDKNLYYVGGVVRDEVLGATSFDIDFCYEGNAIEFAKKQGLNILKENPDFGTVKVLYNNKEIDIASTREENYPYAGHLPVVKNLGCALKDDLSRRDFTINAMAKNTVTGKIIDYFNGMEDIKRKKIKVLHSNSFIDDPTRIIRALKFAVRFSFELDEVTKELQDNYLANINYDMSYHRLKKELIETFNLNKEDALKIFIEQKIYKLLGENQGVPRLNTSIEKLITKYKPRSPWIIYMGLFKLDKLELTSDEKKIIYSVPFKKPETDFEIYNIFKGLDIESILLYALKVDSNIACHYLDNLHSVKIEITGEDLKKIGIPDGKIYKEIFDFILEEKIKNPLIDKQDEINLIKEKYEFI